MAVTKQPGLAKLTIKLQTGIDAKGGPVTVSRSYSKVKPAATDADVYAVAQALAALTNYPLYAVHRIDDAALVDLV